MNEEISEKNLIVVALPLSIRVWFGSSFVLGYLTQYQFDTTSAQKADVFPIFLWINGDF